MNLKNRATRIVVFLSIAGFLAFVCWLDGPFIWGDPPRESKPTLGMGAGEKPMPSAEVGSVIDPNESASTRVVATGEFNEILIEDQKGISLVAEQGFSAAWEIVEQLEVLAESPQSFHRVALPLLRELGVMCLKSEGTTLNLGASVQSELIGRVVQDEVRSPLVRGAVFLGIASELSTETFRVVFDPWLRDSFLSRELLRAAALAAAARGSKPSCSAPINLELLQQLPVELGVPVPSVYPVILTKALGQYEATAVREVLLVLDPLLNQIEKNQKLPEASADLAEAADSLIAREILLAVLGHGSIDDPELRTYILSRARFHGNATVDIRAAYFVINSLSNCSDEYLDFVGESSRSAHPVVSGLSRLMRGSSVGPLNLEYLSELHSMRWCNDVSKNTSFMLEMTRIGKRLKLRKELDESYRTEFLGFLREVVNDESEAETVRMASMNGLRVSGDWDVTMRAATELFNHEASTNLKGLALMALVDVGRSDRSLRLEVIEALSTIRKSTTEQWILADIELFITEFNDG